LRYQKRKYKEFIDSCKKKYKEVVAPGQANKFSELFSSDSESETRLYQKI